MEIPQESIDRFKEATGSTETEARQMITECNGRVDEAIDAFFQEAIANAPDDLSYSSDSSSSPYLLSPISLSPEPSERQTGESTAMSGIQVPSTDRDKPTPEQLRELRAKFLQKLEEEKQF